MVLGFFGLNNIIAQETPKTLDTIYLLGQRKVVVEVKNVSASLVMYYDPKTDENGSYKRKEIQRILYSNGSKEVFNKPVLMMVPEGDWKTVMVTSNKDDVSALYELGKVDGKSSPGSRSMKSAKKSATIRMQKRAASLGATMVLVINEESIGGFGEPPTFYIEGIAYGWQPPQEN